MDYNSLFEDLPYPADWISLKQRKAENNEMGIQFCVLFANWIEKWEKCENRFACLCKNVCNLVSKDTCGLQNITQNFLKKSIPPHLKYLRIT